MSHDFHPFVLPSRMRADKILEDGDFVVIRVNFSGGLCSHLCGYCAIPKKDVPTEWHGDYDSDGLQYLRIHGGITYCEVEGEYIVFGFDCGHAGDEECPELSDPLHILGLAKQMRELILRHAASIKEFRTADGKERCRILDEINDGVSEELGFGAMIDLLGGGKKLRGSAP